MSITASGPVEIGALRQKGDCVTIVAMWKLTSRNRKSFFWLAAVAAVYSACVWFVANSIQPLAKLKLDAPGSQGVIGFSSDGNYFLTTDVRTGNSWGIQAPERLQFPIRVWDGLTGKLTSTIESPSRSDARAAQKSMDITRGMISPDGKRLAVSSEEGRAIFVFDLASRTLQKHITSHVYLDRVPFEFSPDSRSLIAYQHFPFGDASLSKVFQVDGQNINDRVPPKWYCGTLLPDASPLLSMPLMIESSSPFFELKPFPYPRCISRCGNWLVVMECANVSDYPMKPYAVEIRDLRRDESIHREIIESEIAISLDGKQLSVKSPTGKETFNLGAGVTEWPLNIEGMPKSATEISYRLFVQPPTMRHITASKFSPNQHGAFVRVPDQPHDSKYVRWYIVNGIVTEKISFNSALTVSPPDESRLASLEPGDDDNGNTLSVRWRDAETGRCVSLRDVHYEFLNSSLAISCDGNLVALGTTVHRIQGVLSRPMIQRAIQKCSEWTGVDLAKQLLAAGRPRIEIWDGPTGRRLANIRDQYGIAFSPDSKSFATQDESNAVYFWDLPIRRNWPLAAGLAIVPAIIATSFLLTSIFLFRRLRWLLIKRK